MKNIHIIGIVGSLRKKSINLSLMKGFAAQIPEGSTLEIADISDIPLFNQDMEADFPAVVTALKEKIRKADAVIVITPEYNRSIPGVLKNVIDWTSRPYGDGAWVGKPMLVAGATEGALGTAVAQSHLK